MKTCIRVPIPALFAACNSLTKAVDAHLAGDRAAAYRHFKAADSLAVFFWLNPCWYDVEKNVVEVASVGDNRVIPPAERGPDRAIVAAVRAQILARDGYRYRYCGLPVIDARVRKRAHALYPEAVPWDSRDLRRQHAGSAAL